jgi:hypothetical protein
MQLELRGELFDIKFVSNYVHNLWTELTKKASEGQLLTLEIVELQDEIKSKKKPSGERIREIIKEIKNCNAKMHKINEDSSKIVFDILKNVLESNDLEYNEKWWKHRTSVEDVNDFILFALKKDYDAKRSNVKKK